MRSSEASLLATGTSSRGRSGGAAASRRSYPQWAGGYTKGVASSLSLLRISRPPAPYGVHRLARCHSIADLARRARRRLPGAAMGYLDGGGEDEYTLRENRAAFDEYEFAPRVLHDVHNIDLSVTVLGARLPVPFALAPVGAPRLFHHEGELAVARAAHHTGVAYGVSTLATQALEAIAAAAAPSSRWFQLYVWGDRGCAKELLGRAQAAGFSALLVSVDTTVRSKRERELRAGLSLPRPNLTVQTVLDGARHPSWSWHFATSGAITFPNIDAGAPGGGRAIEEMFDGTVSWSDLAWIRHAWDGPIALKGVVTVDDALRAAGEGVDAVIVSNHGGRQLDHLPATIRVLPQIVDAVGDRIEVLCDSGIRRGSDIAVALGLGARAVLVGRAYLYGLAAAGEAGVRHAVDILTDELRTTMALTGAATVAELRGRVVRV